jgi:hypothetical protein
VSEKIRGGLRMGSLAGKKNEALLFKWLWRLARDNIQEV